MVDTEDVWVSDEDDIIFEKKVSSKEWERLNENFGNKELSKVKYKTKAKSDDVIPIRSVQPLPIIGDRLDTAIKACDSWVKFKFGNKLSFILASRFTRWRNQPITKQQLNWIKKRNPLLTDDKLCHLEKGSASNLMTQIIEGAEKNWEKFQKEKGKKEKLLKKLKSQTVHVGPLT
ncbi:6160_t:CDS:2 [Entrophospora sp. SA101]|nr:6160_t:CDS:2 [Entrophospora sp. SA101]